jgi:hypothetical protein
VDRGSDFPPAIEAQINSWQTTCVLRDTPERLTTRGENRYVDESERRDFCYLTEKKRLTGDDLEGSLLQARAIREWSPDAFKGTRGVETSVVCWGQG